MAAPLAVFIHIPKTAGMALKQGFFEAVGHQVIWYHGDSNEYVEKSPIRHIRSLNRLTPGVLRNCRILGGHIRFHTLPGSVMMFQPTFLTIIRDPVARAISLYTYIQRKQTHRLHAGLSPLTLCQALSLPEFRRKACDQQLRFICGKRRRKALRKTLNQHRFIVGKFENLAPFIAAVERHLQIPITLAGQTRNSGGDYMEKVRAQPDFEAAIELLRKLNAKDQQFYDSFEDVLVTGDGAPDSAQPTLRSTSALEITALLREVA